MITHVVLVRWADAGRADEVRVAVRGLQAGIPLIRSLAEGPNVSPEGLGAGFDYGFVVTFDSAADRDEYLTHPAHLPVAALIGDAAVEVVVFDLAG